MQININNAPVPAPNNNSRGKIVVSTRPVRERVFLDKDGNELSSLDPRRKHIIKRADEQNK